MIKYYLEKNVPLEFHKVAIVKKLELVPIERRLEAIYEGGFNTFLLRNRDVFLDMLTDSGVNAMSDQQLSSMIIADDAYAGSETYYRLEEKVKEITGLDYFLPAHQGRACENIIAKTYVKEGSVVPMNYHFTTTKSHIVINGGIVEELIIDEGLDLENTYPFKGNIDLKKLENLIKKVGSENIPFVRMEAGTNLIGGQPFSLQNCQELRQLCDKYNIMMVLDASLLADNLYFIKVREEQASHLTIREIAKRLCHLFDIVYFSARKLGFARGGGIAVKSETEYRRMRELVPLYEGFLTYGGMSVKEMEAICVGLEETMDLNIISQGPQFIEFMTNELVKLQVPVVLPSGGLGCHLNAKKFLPHVKQEHYPAGALASALYIISGIRGMERGTLSEQRNLDGTEHLANVELLRLAIPRRVFTLSQILYAIDRIKWLYDNRDLVGGLEFVEEPKILRFFFGRLKPVENWPEKLVAKFKADFGDSL